MGEIEIRTVSMRELGIIHDLEQISFIEPYPFSLIKSLYFLNPKTFLVAVKQDEIVGYIIATTQTDVGQIISIAVHPSEKRKGIGTSLLTTILCILDTIGMTSVRLEVRRSNISAQRFYEANGFEYAHKIPRYYGTEDAFVYFKFLH